MFLSETLVFIFAMIVTGLLLFLLVYFIITLSDLECDYINAQQCCYRMNLWILPKLIGGCAVSFLFLIHGFWGTFLGSLPPSIFAIYEYWKVGSGNIGVYDPTEIHNRGQLKNHMRNVVINIGFHLVAFFIYLYLMIVAMLKGDPIQPPTLNDFDEF